MTIDGDPQTNGVTAAFTNINPGAGLDREMFLKRISLMKSHIHTQWIRKSTNYNLFIGFEIDIRKLLDSN